MIINKLKKRKFDKNKDNDEGAKNENDDNVIARQATPICICPKPDDLQSLMEGLIDSHKRMKAGNVSPVIHAAAIAYGFVFLHPFENGNDKS